MTEKEKARQRKAAQAAKNGSILKLRATITLEALCYEVEKELVRLGRDAGEWMSWQYPVLAQVRISRADVKGGGTSESPERQLKRIAKYCVMFGLRPEAMCFEAQSGHLTDLKPRKLFNSFRDRIADGSLSLSAVVTYNIDRFTRDKLIGEEWFKVLKQRGVHLYEAEGLKPPQPLHEMEDSYTQKLHGAWRESQRTSSRIREAHAYISDEGRLISGYNDAFGHDYIVEPNVDGISKRVGLRVVEEEARWLREATRRLAAGEALHSILVNFHARGHAASMTVMRTRLRSPRMCGLQRVQGVLKPANIEPIITVAEWEHNCGVLREGTGRGYRRHPLSGLLICGVCGERMVGGSKSAKGDAYYRCSKKSLHLKERCICGRPDGRCRCRKLRGRVSADGKTHATRQDRFIERFVRELIRLSYDHGTVTAEAASSLTGLAESQLQELEEQRVSVLTRRRELVSLVSRGLADSSDVEADLKDIAAELERQSEQRQSLANRRTVTAQRDSPDEFLRRLNSEGAAYLRSQANIILRRLVVRPARNNMRPYDGLEPQFVEGYDVPAELIQALAQHLNNEFQEQHWLARSHGKQLSIEVEDAIYGMWANSELTTGQLARRLTEDGVVTGAGRGSWTASAVAQALKRACARRGGQYVSRKRSRSPYPETTRRLVYEMCREKRPFADIIKDLEAMDVFPPGGLEWTQNRLRGVYASECAARGDKPVGRRQLLPEELARQVRVMVKVNGKSYQDAADWLNAMGVPRQSGKRWDGKAIDTVLTQEERRLRRQAAS